MPIQAGSFHVTGGEAAARKAAGNYGNGDDARNNVKEMQTGDAEKSGAKKRRAPWILEKADTFVDHAEPFTNVKSGENHAKKNGGPEKALRLGFIAEFGGVHGAEHGETTGDQNRGHDHDVENAGIEPEGRGPVGAGGAQVTVPE